MILKEKIRPQDAEREFAQSVAEESKSNYLKTVSYETLANSGNKQEKSQDGQATLYSSVEGIELQKKQLRDQRMKEIELQKLRKELEKMQSLN